MKFTIQTSILSTFLILSTVFAFAIPVGECNNAFNSLTEDADFTQAVGLHLRHKDVSGNTLAGIGGKAGVTSVLIKPEMLPEVMGGTELRGSGFSIAHVGRAEESDLVEATDFRVKYAGDSGIPLPSTGKLERSAKDATTSYLRICYPYDSKHGLPGSCLPVDKAIIEARADDISIKPNHAHRNSPLEKRGPLPSCNPQEHPEPGTCIPIKNRSYRDRLPPCDPKRHGPNPKPGWCIPIDTSGK